MTVDPEFHVVNLQMKLMSPYAPTTDGEYESVKAWEGWFLGLRAHLHDIAHEDMTLKGVGPIDEFLDIYGLAIEVDAGRDCLIEFLKREPPRPAREFQNFPIQKLGAIVDYAAVAPKPVPYGDEKMKEAAIALRARAADYLALAERIEDGVFRFPSWEDGPELEDESDE
ncbi:hypothetical protein [Methylobacterium dankookense]|uniref:hypothetical protein n=1 Tax=Methylobacterium dankookense TaxID=560405 RepID=UPI0011A3F469|nr:hypothetical protein [Methylobacterium dankookense]